MGQRVKLRKDRTKVKGVAFKRRELGQKSTRATSSRKKRTAARKTRVRRRRK